MKVCTKVLFVIILLVSQLVSSAQEKQLIENKYGVVNFDLRTAPTPNYKRQEISLMGCNTEVTSKTRFFEGDTNLKWGVDNQIFNKVPFGLQTEGDRSYYVSKYYMASPPVMKLPYNGRQVNIGLVLPDQFNLYGESPAQMVRLDYSVLEPVFLNFIPVAYDRKEDSTCSKLGVNLVPLVIECDDFNWRKDGPTPDAKGASGVARIKNDSANRQVFLPSYDSSANYLNCNLRILDDIILKYDIHFLTEEGESKTVNMSQYYTDSRLEGQAIQLVCRSRSVNPPGCKEKGKHIIIER